MPLAPGEDARCIRGGMAAVALGLTAVLMSTGCADDVTPPPAGASCPSGASLVMFCSGDGDRLITCVHGDVVKTEHCGQELCRTSNSSPYCLVSTAPDPLCDAMGLYRRCVGNESVACIDQARTTSSLDCSTSGETCQPDGSCQ